ncbi:MAG: DinB family protein [Spirochaetaceae bacterium]|nr:DinB family protein [Spirochaetaceae bacterium]
MKNVFLVQARYNKATDKTVYDILSGLSNDEREKDRGGYFKSLSQTFRHYIGSAGFFHGALQSAVNGNAAARKALSYEAPKLPDGPLSEAQWKTLAGYLNTVNDAFIQFVEALRPEDFAISITFGPPAWPPVPLYFLLMMIHSHAIHHRGQISEMLDEMKVENNWSGMNPDFLPKA